MVGRELCEAPLSTNIPCKKLENGKLRTFLETHIDVAIPNKSTIHKNYAIDCFNNIMDKIRSDLEGSPTWIGKDETTDVAGCYVGNVLIGKLDNEKHHTPYLISSPAPSSTSVTRQLLVALSTTHCTRSQLTLTRTSPGCCSPMLHLTWSRQQGLESFLPHVTCLAHGLHHVCEKTREIFPEMNGLISNVKKIFLKAPARHDLYKESCNNLLFPP